VAEAAERESAGVGFECRTSFRGNLAMSQRLEHRDRLIAVAPVLGREDGMGYYALFYEVVDDFAERRAPFRDEHLRQAREAHHNGEIVLAGALAEPADGALLIFRGESPDVAASFAQRDPYVRHGLVRNWEVRPWTVVVGGDSAASANRASGGV